MRPEIDLVHVIFKTHLDVGFTDYARNVIHRYMNQFIPGAIALARQMQQQHPDEPFRWTVGSWLIYEYLERATPEQRQQMEDAIRDELVAWHALPVTTHTELLDAELFRYGLSLSQRLDARYGRETIAGKMTDVPGHTRAMVPLLAQAGVRMFHVGVNPAASVPDVPPVFIWRDDPTQTEVIMMYQHVYGDTMLLPGTSEAVAIIFTGDNLGPPSPESVHQTYAELRQQFPNARFIGSTLDAVARSLIAAKPDLPIITAEIGDTWIQGAGTDPTKVSQYRELLRLRTTWRESGRIDEAHLDKLNGALLMIPEHTWGMDLKTHLADYEQYNTDILPQARTQENFRTFEASWQEQRDYVTAAVETLQDTPLYDEAQQRLQSLRPQRPDLSQHQTTTETHFTLGDWAVGLDAETGALNHLVYVPTGHTLADADHPLALFTYEAFSTDDYERYWQQYIRNQDDPETREWAIPDNLKPGLQVAEHQGWYLTVQQVYTGEGEILLEAALPPESQWIGAPEVVYLAYSAAPTGDLEVTVRWFDKPACRKPEAFWLTMQPLVPDAGQWWVRKLGHRIDPTDVVSKAARTLHGFDKGVCYQGDAFQLDMDSLDAPLVAPGKPSMLDFHNQLPDLSGGMHFNLYNNIWGTNFPMWFEDDAQFRFRLGLKTI